MPTTCDSLIIILYGYDRKDAVHDISLMWELLFACLTFLNTCTCIAVRALMRVLNWQKWKWLPILNCDYYFSFVNEGWWGGRCIQFMILEKVITSCFINKHNEIDFFFVLVIFIVDGKNFNLMRWIFHTELKID